VFKVWGSLESLEEVARTVADVAIWQGLASATPQHFPTLAYVSVSTHKIFSFNDSVYMATWVGHTSKKLLPLLLGNNFLSLLLKIILQVHIVLVIAMYCRNRIIGPSELSFVKRHPTIRVYCSCWKG
jgi:hypothetical protein